MKKRAGVLAAALAAAILLTACGNKEYLKDIKASNYVTLGEYTDIKASAEEPVVEDGTVDLYIDMYFRSPQATIEEVAGRTVVQTGDTVNIDYEGYIDGELFDGGSAAGTNLTIGSHQFIEGFEDGLIGAKIGEKVTLNLAFPDPYLKNPGLSGVPVVFEVEINSIGKQKLPELTDGFVQSLGIEGCSTKKELWDQVYDYFYQNAVQSYENKIEAALTDAVMANCTFKKLPKKMEERFAKNIEDALTAQASVQRLSLAEYMSDFYGMDEETYRKKFEEDATLMTQQYIMYQAIADVEGLNPTQEELQAEIDYRVENLHYESEEDYRKNADVELLREQLMRNHVMSFLKEHGKIETVTAEESKESN